MKNFKTIEFNKVTWYSKLIAVILFILIIPAWAFYIGTQYEKTADLVRQNEINSSTTNIASSGGKNIHETSSSDMCNYIWQGTNPPKTAQYPITCTFTIAPALAPYTFIIGNKKIDIARGKTHIQTIDLSDAEFSTDNSAVVSLKDDFNFDGYRDIWIESSTGASNDVHDLWVYDPTTGLFALDPVLRGLTTAGFDPVLKQVVTHAYSCAGLCFTNDTFTFTSGKYVLTREEDQQPVGNDYKKFRNIIKKLQGGTMQVVSDKIITADQYQN